MLSLTLTVAALLLVLAWAGVEWMAGTFDRVGRRALGSVAHGWPGYDVRTHRRQLWRGESRGW